MRLRSAPRRRPSSPLLPLALGALLTLTACGGEDEAAAQTVGPEVQARMQALMDGLVPPPADATHDVLAAYRRARKDVIQDYGDEGREFGEVARAIYVENPEAVAPVRRGLLQAAAANLGPEGEQFLVDVLDAYEEDLALRTTACELLAEFHPERAVQFLEPILIVSKPDRTWPAGDLMLGAWDTAARSIGADRAPLLVRVSTDIYQKDGVRHRAVQALADVDDPRAVAALEQVLKESTGNMYLRIKAAQSLVEQPDMERSCAILTEVLEREVDPNMQLLLADVLQAHCR